MVHIRELGSCLPSDGVAILLVGATALTTHSQSWVGLAEAYKGNASPTKISIFEKEGSTLVRKIFCRLLGGGYLVCEFDLQLIDKYLANSISAPEPYPALMHIWSRGTESRAFLSKIKNTMIEEESLSRDYRPPKSLISSPNSPSFTFALLALYFLSQPHTHAF